MKPARIYGRFSSKPQERGQSKTQQINGGTEYANTHDFEIVGVYFDEAVSGKDGLNLEREFGRLLKESKRGETILVYIFDRFGRQDPFELGTIIKNNFIDRGVSVLEWSTGELLTPENWQNKRIQVFFKSETSNQENSRKIDRQRRNWQGKRDNASNKPLTATCPSWVKPILEQQGLKNVPVGFELIPAHAAIVKRIFELSLKGMGNMAITKLFNREGVKGIGGVDSWHTSVIDRILRNRAVLGEFQPMKYMKDETTKKKFREPVGEPIKNYYPAINGITEAMFNAVQFKRKERTTGGRRDSKGTIGNLFTSICRCGFCGGNMIYTQKRSNTLVCDNARRGNGCRYVGYPYQEFETSFLKFVSELNLDEILNADPDNSKISVQIEQCRAMIDATQTKIDNLGEAIAEGKGKSLVKMVDKLEEDLKLQNHNLTELLTRQSAIKVETIKVSELQVLIARCQTDSKDINEIRSAVREAIRTITEKIEVFPYEICKPIKRSELKRAELRATTAAGYLIDSEFQTVERCYRVWFKNEETFRGVFSHPKWEHTAKGNKVSAKAVKAS